MPAVESVLPTINAVLVRDMVLALKTVPEAAPLTGAFINLFTAVANPISPNSAFGDFTLPTFTGGAPVAATWASTPIVLDSSSGLGLLATASFVCAELSSSETILGYFVSDSANANCLMAELFQTPIPITESGDFVVLTVVVPVQYQVAV